MDKTIDELIIWADGISALWNGDESGLQEDNATLATEIIDKLEEVIELVKELEENEQ